MKLAALALALLPALASAKGSRPKVTKQPPQVDPHAIPAPPKNAKHYVAVRLRVVGGDAAQLRDAELRTRSAIGRTPFVAVQLLSKSGTPEVPSAERLASAHLSGWVVDATIKLKPSDNALDCKVNGLLGTWPGATIVKATISTQAQVTGIEEGMERLAAEQCFDAAATTIAEHVKAFLAKKK